MHTNTRKWFLILGIFVNLLFATMAFAQQPTATITYLSGKVVVNIQGNEQAAKEGLVLATGDTLITQANADVLLTLSEGSTLQFGENSKIEIAHLLQTPAGARESRLKLLYGRVRMMLSGGHQKEGSSFVVETPQAQIGVKFSQPDVEVVYDPQTKTTIARAYTVAVSVLNLVSKAEVKELPRGQQAIVHQDSILVTKIMELSRLSEELSRTAQALYGLGQTVALPGETARTVEEAKMDLLLETRAETAAQVPATSQIPIVGPPQPGAETTGVSITLTEE